VPEGGALYHESFDEYYAPQCCAPITVAGAGTLVASWSGYALDRSGPWVPPWVVPALDASGSTNVTCNSGAVRFWFEPYSSSATVPGGTGPGAAAHLVDLVATGDAGTVLCWSLQMSADGSALQLVGEADSGPVELLAAPLAWPAYQAHLIALDYSPVGTALFLDGQLAAQGAGTLAIPPSAGALVLGSSFAGADTADGALDEFFPSAVRWRLRMWPLITVSRAARRRWGRFRRRSRRRC
jgi:hypothetical protein